MEQIVNQKKVCIFSAQYLPSLGGVERYVHNMATKLAEKGVEVTVVTSGITTEEDEISEKLKIYRIPSIAFGGGRMPVPKIWANKTKKVIHELKNKTFDLVITNTRFYILSVIGVWLGSRCGNRNIVVEHGTSYVSIGNKFLDKIENVYEHVLTSFVKHYSKEFFGVSKACNEWLKTFHIDTNQTLYNAVDLKSIEMIISEEGEDVRAKYDISNQAVLIGFTGRLLEEKGIYKLIDSYLNIKNEYSQIQVVIAGNGPELEKIREKNLEGVILTGTLGHREVLRLLKEVDIFCFPTDYPEGLSTSVLEAIACNCFVITTQRGGAKEVIINDEYGIIVKNNAVEDIESALKMALNSKEYREKVALKCKQERLKNYTWDCVVDSILKMM